MGQPQPLFHLFLSFQHTLHFLQQINVKMSIQYMGFELITFGTQLSSHNHLTRVPAQNEKVTQT